MQAAKLKRLHFWCFMALCDGFVARAKLVVGRFVIAGLVPAISIRGRGVSIVEMAGTSRPRPSRNPMLRPLRSLLDLQSETHQFGEVFRADALHHPGTVIFYGLRTDVEPRGDFLIRQTDYGKFHYLSLTLRQCIEA